jgi:hypothetical protein
MSHLCVWLKERERRGGKKKRKRGEEVVKSQQKKKKYSRGRRESLTDTVFLTYLTKSLRLRQKAKERTAGGNDAVQEPFLINLPFEFSVKRKPCFSEGCKDGVPRLFIDIHGTTTRKR